MRNNFPTTDESKDTWKNLPASTETCDVIWMKDVERKDSFGKTPLHYAQAEGHFSTARILELRLIERNCAAKRFKSQ